MKKIYVILIVLLAACQSVDNSARAKTASSGPSVSKDVPYAGQNVGDQQSLDIYTPIGSLRELLPVHVYVHGGAWTKGDKSRVKAKQARAYTDQGIVFVSLNYRLAPAHKFPANSDDIVRASEWLADNIHSYGGDPENMVLSGHSAGAHLVALFAVGSSAVPSQPSAELYHSVFSVDTATFDLTLPSGEGLLSGFLDRQKRKTFGTKPRVLRQASPIHQIEPNADYSNLYLYATAERINAVESVNSFARALTRQGYAATTRIIPDLSHREMNDALFTPGNTLFGDVVAALGVVMTSRKGLDESAQ